MRQGSRSIATIAAAVLACLVSLAQLREARAFPSSIGYGYGSCTTCHYNPAGNGPLTDYGRALFATALADRPFIQALGRDDDDLTAKSGFLGTVGLPDFLRLSGDFRGMLLATQLESTPSLRAFPMQADGNLVLRFLDDRLLFSGTLGYVPVPATIAPEDRSGVSTWISREHYLGVRPVDWIDFYIGMMDPVFGLRVPEHNAWIRSQPGLDRNDQTHGALVHLGFERFELFVHGMLGNLLQTSALRQRGASVMGEWEAVDGLRLGASWIRTSNSFRIRQAEALHARLGIGEGSSVLAEVGSNQNLGAETGATVGGFAFLQTTTRVARGTNVLFNFEFAVPDSHSLFRQFRAGPSLQWLPMQRLELRVDFLSTRTIDNPEIIQHDDYTLQSQLHLAL